MYESRNAEEWSHRMRKTIKERYWDTPPRLGPNLPPEMRESARVPLDLDFCKADLAQEGGWR